MIVGVFGEESLLPLSLVLPIGVVEAAAALDEVSTGSVVFATLVDDPASVGDTLDAYLGEIMLETASAADSYDVGFNYDGAIADALTAAETEDASVSSAPATTWNSSDKSANITLSNSDLTAQTTTTSDGGVRSTASRSSGKYYFEVTWSSNLGGGNTGSGIATSSANLGTIGGSASGGSLCFVSGNIYFNGSFTTSITMGSAPFTICVAVDLTNSRLWYRSGSGSWSNSGNPATNTGGIDISALFPSNAVFAVQSCNGNTTPTYTANFGASTFAQTPPSGFSAFGP